MMNYPIIFDHKLPTVLYHYTSQQGLIGIVESRSIWATHIRYLNDSSEYSYGEDVIREVISERRKGVSGNLKKFFDDFDGISDLFSDTHFFITSLTENGDLLSQWRGYTQNGNGFCVGFNTEELGKVLAKGSEFNLLRCVYERAEQEDLVNQAIDYAIGEWDRPDETPSKQETRLRIHPPAMLRISCSFLAPVFKNITFSEEQEWRLIFSEQLWDKWKFRTGQSMIIPYIEVSLLPDALEPIPISEVIVGPTPHSDLAQASVQMLLYANNLPGFITSIRMSDIPFRSW